MKRKIPQTRAAAAAPNATNHLNHGQQTALELSEEADHATGPTKEKLIKQATQVAKAPLPKR